MRSIRFVITLICAAFLSACLDGRERLPTYPITTEPPTNTPTPQPPIAAIGSIAGFVIDADEQCIIGARVEMIDGPQAGKSFVQTVCGFWDYGADLGYSFHNLPAGVAVTIRATAEGYKPAEKTAVPTNPFQYTTMIVVTKE